MKSDEAVSVIFCEFKPSAYAKCLWVPSVSARSLAFRTAFSLDDAIL